jgi:hypothetical protein
MIDHHVRKLNGSIVHNRIGHTVRKFLGEIGILLSFVVIRSYGIQEGRHGEC